jgi:hypothetical protein
MTTRVTILAAVCAIVAVVGCGDQDGPPSSQQLAPSEAAPTTAASVPEEAEPSEEDKRGIALVCIRDRMGIDARAVGTKTIQVGAGDDGPRIDFFQSSLEAEGEQFEGRGEGAEQVGAALLYVRGAGDELLIELEECLDEQ